MAEIYRVFQIIMGIILSVFILYILISYSGGYSGVQQSLDRATIVKNFITDSRSVYFTGNAINFTDFDAYDFSNCGIDWRQEPHIVCVSDDEEIRSEDIHIPIFFNSGSGVVITRDVIDFGWWQFYYITAPGRTKILFNPLEASEDVWDLVSEIVYHMPDTTGFSPKTTYGFCDSSQKIELLCSDSLCEQSDFSSLLSRSNSDTSFYSCTADLTREYRLIVVSSNCQSVASSSGICVTPKANGAGRLVFLDTGDQYVYTDASDIVAAAIGSTDKDIFGNTEGENFLELKRKMFFRMVRLAADEMVARSDLIISNLPASRSECIDAYGSFRDSMEIILQLLDLDMDQEAIAQTFSTEMENAGSLWQELINRGCEYID